MKKLMAVGLILGLVTTQSEAGLAAGGSRFIRGDANCDSTRDISDPIYLLNYLFKSGASPCCDEIVDINADGASDISDAIYDLNFQFGVGPPPPAPHPYCGRVRGVECPGHPCELPRPPAIALEWVTVSNPGNDPNPESGLGAVAGSFRIAKYEVSNSQWAAFMNRVDPTGDNKLGLFDEVMAIDSVSGIKLAAGNVDGAKYVVKEGRGDKPVIYVSWLGAVRFCNWLHNGQVGPGSTEDGAYERMGCGPITDVANDEDYLLIERTAWAAFYLPNENEWYKAAYFQPSTGKYLDFATQSDTEPTAEAPPGGPNSANTFGAVFDVTDVGAYVNAPSAYGTFDQCGNVTEWMENSRDSVPRAPFIRGGSWSSSSCHSAIRGISGPSVRSFNTGFRPAGRILSP